MAIALDSLTSGAAATQSASVSWSHTCTGSDLTLVVVVSYRNNGGTNPQVSTCTYNSVSLTQQAVTSYSWAGDNFNVVEIWTMDDPPTGSAYTVAVTMNEAPAGLTEAFVAIASSWTGSQGIGTNTGSSTGNSQTHDVTFTTEASTSLIIAGLNMHNGYTVTEGSSPTVTERFEGKGAGASMKWVGTMAASGGSDTVGISNPTANSRFATAAIELKEAAASGGGYEQFLSLPKRRLQHILVR